MNQKNYHWLLGMLCRVRVYVIAACTILLFAASTHGNTWVWTGGGGINNGNWNNAANWGSAGVPAIGDSVVFQGATGLNSTNNIAGLTLNQIKFIGAGFNIYGLPLTLTNSVVATNFTGDILINNMLTNATADLNLLISNSVILTLNGNISGPMGVIKNGLGTVEYSGPNDNTYTGTTLVLAGTLQLDVGGYSAFDGPLVIGDGSGLYNPTVEDLIFSEISEMVPITINSSGTLNLNNNNEAIGANLTLNGGSIQTGTATLIFTNNTTITLGNGFADGISGNLNIGTGTLTLQGNGTLNFAAAVNGTANIVQNDLVNTIWSGSNSYMGNFTANTAGYVDLHTPQSLGNTNNILTLNGQALVANDGVNLTNQAVILNTTNVGLLGPYATIYAYGTTNIWQANFVLNSNCTIFPVAGATLRLVGPISGPAGFTQLGGTLFLDGASTNTYAGSTVVSNNAILMLNKSAFDGAIPGNLDIKGGGTVRYANINQIANAADVLVESGGTYDFATFYDDINTLHGTGNVTFGLDGYLKIGLLGGTSEFDGLMSGLGYNPGYTVGKFGTGTFTLTANNTFLNSFYVSGGTLLVNGNQPQNPLEYLATGATFGGSGTVGSIFDGFSAISGTISPGNNGPGILTCSNATFSSAATFKVELTGPNPGPGGYDQLNVRGTNNLGNATLTVIPAFTTPVAIGQPFIIISNDLADAINGIFTGHPQGSSFSVGNYTFNISYTGGTGNDVVLTLTSLPATVVASGVTSGNGSHAIDPNGCNNFNLVVSNTAGTAMTGITATLSTTTGGLLISQPYASYSNIPANGTGTNLAPFQISTLPNFVCGTPINLQLTVNSSLGAFTINYVLTTGELAAPSRYDVTGNVAIPDIGTVDSTNVVSGFTVLPLNKVTVSLYLTHQFDADLTNISLISPDGTTVLLSAANGGGGQNYGSALSPDADRTTFDDAAGISITNGTAPFVGTFGPQAPLSAFIGNATPNGNWHLHIADGFGGSLGTLRGWSLFLYGTSCNSGGGSCDYCLTSVTGSITNTDLVQTGRLTRNGLIASCGAPKGVPSQFDSLLRHYDVYGFTNTSADEACVTVLLAAKGDVQAAVYTNSFNPNNISLNYAADSGDSTADNTPGPQSCSVSIPSGAIFYVTVNEMTPNAGCTNYTVQLSGLPCPPPTLNIQPVSPGKARLYWDTSAGGYVLQSVSNLTTTAWGAVTNEPIVIGNNYSVTNSTAGPATNQFYRLQHP